MTAMRKGSAAYALAAALTAGSATAGEGLAQIEGTRIYASAESSEIIAPFKDSLYTLTGKSRDVIFFGPGEAGMSDSAALDFLASYPGFTKYHGRHERTGQEGNILASIIMEMRIRFFASSVVLSEATMPSSYRYTDTDAPQIGVIVAAKEKSPSEFIEEVLFVDSEAVKAPAGNADDWRFLFLSHEAAHLSQSAEVCRVGYRGSTRSCLIHVLAREADADDKAFKTYNAALKDGVVQSAELATFFMNTRILSSVLSPVALDHATGPFFLAPEDERTFDQEMVERVLDSLAELKQIYWNLFGDEKQRDGVAVLKNYHDCPLYHARAAADMYETPDVNGILSPLARQIAASFRLAAEAVFKAPDEMTPAAREACDLEFKALTNPPAAPVFF